MLYLKKIANYIREIGFLTELKYFSSEYDSRISEAFVNVILSIKQNIAGFIISVTICCVT